MITIALRSCQFWFPFDFSIFVSMLQPCFSGSISTISSIVVWWLAWTIAKHSPYLLPTPFSPVMGRKWKVKRLMDQDKYSLTRKAKAAYENSPLPGRFLESRATAHVIVIREDKRQSQNHDSFLLFLMLHCCAQHDMVRE